MKSLGKAAVAQGVEITRSLPRRLDLLAARAPALAIAFSVGVTGLLIVARLGSFARAPMFWAEDATIFFVQQHMEGFRAVLFRPYAGYLNVYPRLVAGLADNVSLLHAPEIYFAGWCVAAIWAAATIATCRIEPAWLLGALLMVAPHEGGVFGVLTNSQWLLAPALALVLATPAPANRWAQVNQVLLVVASGLSGPFILFTLPMLLVRLVSWKGRADRLIGLVALVAVLIQAITIGLFSDTAGPPGNATRVLQPLWIPFDRWLGGLAHGGPSANAATLTLVVLLVAALALTVARDERRVTLLLLLAFAACIVVGAWYKFRYEPGLLARRGDRFFFIPRTIAIWVLVRGAWRADWMALVPFASLVGIALNYSHDQWERKPLPRLDWPPAAARIERGEGVRFPVHPLDARGAHKWVLDIPPRTPTGTGATEPGAEENRE